jgi:hypothetical protein
MILTLLLAFIGGVLGGNAIPHFIRGITRQRYPNVWGGGVPMLLRGDISGGWEPPASSHAACA